MNRLLTEAEGDDKWIQKAVKRPGRCKDMGSADCPKGSPQFNLAKRFKKGGDLHKGEAAESTTEMYGTPPGGHRCPDGSMKDRNTGKCVKVQQPKGDWRPGGRRDTGDKRHGKGRMFNAKSEADDGKGKPFFPHTPKQKENNKKIHHILAQAEWWVKEYPSWVKGFQGVSGMDLKKFYDPIYKAMKRLYDDKSYGYNAEIPKITRKYL